MIRFTFQKLLHKKWLNLCTFLGMFLLIGITVGNTLYEGAALNRVLQTQFDNYIGENNAYPATISIAHPFEMEEGMNLMEEAQETVNQMKDAVCAKVDCYLYEEVYSIACESLHCLPQYKPDDSKQEYFFIPTFLQDIEQHAKILKGSMYAENPDADGIYECIINESIVANYHLAVGEILTFDAVKTDDGKPIKMRVAGIFKESDSHDAYWVKAPNEYEKNVFISKEAMRDLMDRRTFEKKGNADISYQLLFDYTNVDYKEAVQIRKGTEELTGGDFPYGRAVITSDIPSIVKDYEQAAGKVRATMQTLQVPLYVLLFAFLYMVSSQVFDMEQNEIAMLKSRGVSRGQIVMIYLFQAWILAVLGTVPGVLLGVGLTKVLGSANAFMEFVSRSRLQLVWDGRLAVTLLVVIVAAVLIMTLPSLKYAALSVVEIKAKKNKTDKPMWQRYYVDVILAVLALYIRYNLSRQQDSISQQIIKGESIDPVLFLSSVLFILGCGLFFLRILKAFTRLVYRLGKKHWKPAAYVSFLQLIRGFRQLNFISVFLILTIAMGIFYADTARTMNTSMEERIRYDNGADIVIEEQWKNNVARVKRYGGIVSYEEPDYMRYSELKDVVDSMTRVINEDSMKILYGGKIIENNQLMAIQTKEFGETAWMKDDALDKHWYHYLNDLGQNPGGVLVSSNFRDQYGATVGDRIQYSLMDELGTTRAVQTATIVGFVDMWPGYPSYKMVENADGSVSYQDNYLIVANFSQVVNGFGATPYEIWFKTDEGSSLLTDFAQEKGIELLNVKSTADDMIRQKTDAVVQLTNGLLTVSFIVVMILCTVGFLIHWTLTIRKRELMYGIYRAMGMGMKEVIGMLLHEQVFASAFAIAGGAGVGFLAAYLYIPLVMIAYLPQKHVLAVNVMTAAKDMAQIAVVLGIMLVICFTVLSKVVKNMKIAQALKLGED